MTQAEDTNVDAIQTEGTNIGNVAEKRTDRPVVGIDATVASLSDLARVVLRAHIHDSSVIVAHRDATGEAVLLAESAGAVVVDVRESSPESPRHAVEKAAKEYGYRSLIWHDDLSNCIDYEQSVRNAETSEQYVVTASVDKSFVERDADVVVAIPAYNEESTIAEVVTESSRFTDHLFVVDDGSDDETRARAEAAGATVIGHDSNRGYGAAIKTAFEQAAQYATDHLVILDGDGQHNPADIPKLVKTQREMGSEVVIGSRYMTDGGSDVPLYRRLGLSVVNVMTNIGLGLFRPKSWIRDTQSGFRVYNADAIRSIAAADSIGDRMSASTDIIYHAHSRDYSIVEVGTEITYDVENGNSQNPVSHGVTLISNLLKLIERERPITLIGVPGFVVAFVGLTLGYWTFTLSVNTGSFPFNLAFASIFFALTGVLACFSAIILHAIEVQIP